MNIYLKSIVNQLSNYSATLNKTSIFIDKPWALIDDEFEMQKLIFRKDKELILSKNGQVQIGKWDYFPEAKSLLIDRNSDKLLLNEAFVNEGVMILRLDGTNNKFFILANENIIPDLDVNRYLKELRYQRLKIVETKLVDGKILEVQREDEFLNPEIGNPVTIEAESIKDGKYQLEKQNKYFDVKEGRIFKILTETIYINPDGIEILILQQSDSGVKKGDNVFMFGKPVGDAIVNFSKSENLLVREGIVVRKESKNKFIRWLRKPTKTRFDNNED